MNRTAPASAQDQAVFEVIGFDRIQFVSEIMDAIPQDDHCRLTGVCFEADGIRATGRFTVQVDDRQQLALINRRLRIVRGLVRVTQLLETV